ncbi:MAG TPA: SGNH/GDSL hydrolase family protein [Planctomycetota bacterium]|nr:SGNH/GDSL hydrolase family protein [Planctomycetota bacterium]
MTKSHIPLLSAALLLAFAARTADAPFEFKPNDRVVFIGDALIERDIQYNYLETMLTVRLHGKGVTFRNAGWSGDTVWGESRSVFGTQKDGYTALVRIIGETKPTVAFLNYGMNESFAGPDGLARFEEQYNTLLDDLNKASPGVRVVLISPIAFQMDEAPEAARNPKVNENLKAYTAAIERVAAKHAAIFVNMFSETGGDRKMEKQFSLTSDGMHLTADGYETYAVHLLVDLKIMTGLEHLNMFAPAEGKYDKITTDPQELRVHPQEQVRALIREKNLQFFNKWRPQNETYLFLFRKHEQGKNAKEIPEFDPIIAAKEAEIAKMADEVAKQMGL